MTKHVHPYTVIVVILCAIALVLLTDNNPTAASAAPEDLPPNSEQFICYEFGLPSNSIWTFPDDCFSYALGTDPFESGVPAGKLAIITDFQATPTTSSAGSYYYGIRQSTTGGSGFNPQIFGRSSDSTSYQLHNTSPILIINSGNTLQFFNSSSSPGEARILAFGFIVDDVTYTPTAVEELQGKIQSNSHLLRGIVVLILIGLLPITFYKRPQDEAVG
jgi:hypothetical protein